MEKRSLRGALGIAAVATALAILAGCTWHGIGNRTSLRIIVEPEAGLKQIVPELPMVCAYYDVTGSGPTPFSFTITSNTTVEDLLAGEYTVNIVGKNVLDVPIGEGTNTASVIPGSVATCIVTLSEYHGVGDFLLHLIWDPPIIESPTVYGLLTDKAGFETQLDFFNLDPVNGTAYGSALGLPRGWYSCIVKIYDGAELRAGFADVVRIVAGQPTDGTVSVHVVQGYSSLEVRIVSGLCDPLHFSGNLSAIIPGGVFPAFSVTEDESIAFDGVWYLNGMAIGTGSRVVLFELELQSMLFDEDYRLDFIGFSLDGRRAGAAHGIIRRIEDVPPP